MKKRFTIFVVVVIGIGALLLAAGIITDYYVKQHLTSDLVSDYTSEEQTLGNETSQTLTEDIAGIESTLYATSLNPNIQSLNPAVCSPTLHTYYDSLNIGVGNIARINPQGIFYCTINPAIINKSVFSINASVAQIFNDPNHNPIVSRATLAPGVSGYSVAVHVPVWGANHTFLGSIGGAIYLNQLASSYLSKVRFATTGHASLQDDDGTILYSQTSTNIGKNYFSSAIQQQVGDLTQLNQGILAARQGKASVVTYVTKGVKKVASVTPVDIAPGHRWIVLISVPVSEVVATFIHSGLNNAFNIIFGVFGVAIILVVLLLIVTSYSSYKLQLAKDQFLSLVSHQLRTPLTAIRLFSEMTLDPAVGMLNEKQKEYTEKIHISCVRMISLVGDILNVSRIDLNHLKIEPVPTNLVELIQSKIDEVQPLAGERHITIEAKLPGGLPEIALDQNLFGQVVHNLLTNAIRYSPENTGHILVNLNAQRNDIIMSVSDNGIGIPAKVRKKIFSKFYRADNAIKVAGDGTGLGLYLIKMIMKSTGGNVWFESTENKGTTFYVKLPHTGMRQKKGFAHLK